MSLRNEHNVRHAYTNARAGGAGGGGGGGLLSASGPRQSCPTEAVPTWLSPPLPSPPGPCVQLSSAALFSAQLRSTSALLRPPASFISSVMQRAAAGLPLRKGRPLYVITKHTKFNYSGKGEPGCHRLKVIHRHSNLNPLQQPFCFSRCFYYWSVFFCFFATLVFSWVVKLANMPLPHTLLYVVSVVVEVLAQYSAP